MHYNGIIALAPSKIKTWYNTSMTYGAIKPNWTIIFYFDPIAPADEQEMVCPHCGHHLLEHNAVNAVMSNRDELKFLPGTAINMIKLKCKYCGANFTIIFQEV